MPSRGLSQNSGMSTPWIEGGCPVMKLVQTMGVEGSSIPPAIGTLTLPYSLCMILRSFN